MAIKARVIGMRNDLLKLETIANHNCEGCTACSKGQAGMTFYAKSDTTYPINSIVEVDMPASDLNMASFLVYGLPLILLLLGLFGGNWLYRQTPLASMSEVLGFLTGLLLAAGYYLYMRKNQERVNRDGRFTATVLGLSKEDLCQF